jgi:hypothetical protein
LLTDVTRLAAMPTDRVTKRQRCAIVH